MFEQALLSLREGSLTQRFQKHFPYRVRRKKEISQEVSQVQKSQSIDIKTHTEKKKKPTQVRHAFRSVIPQSPYGETLQPSRTGQPSLTSHPHLHQALSPGPAPCLQGYLPEFLSARYSLSTGLRPLALPLQPLLPLPEIRSLHSQPDTLQWLSWSPR